MELDTKVKLYSYLGEMELVMNDFDMCKKDYLISKSLLDGSNTEDDKINNRLYYLLFKYNDYEQIVISFKDYLNSEDINKRIDYAKALILLNQSDELVNKGLDILYKAREEKSTKACCILGLLYFNNMVIKKDTDKAIEYFLDAIKYKTSGDEDFYKNALKMLVSMPNNKISNEDKIKYLHELEDYDSSYAHCRLAMIYRFGLYGYSIDYEKYFDHICRTNEYEGLLRLGIDLIVGEELIKNEEAGLDILYFALKNNNKPISGLMGLYYSFNNSIMKNKFVNYLNINFDEMDKNKLNLLLSIKDEKEYKRIVNELLGVEIKKEKENE